LEWNDGIIVARTDSEGAGLTQTIPVSMEKGDLASQYIGFLKTEEVHIADVKMMKY
jgi:isocitrate lyase